MKRDLVVTKGTPGEVLNICFEVSQSRHVLVAVGEERREEEKSRKNYVLIKGRRLKREEREERGWFRS